MGGCVGGWVRERGGVCCVVCGSEVEGLTMAKSLAHGGRWREVAGAGGESERCLSTSKTAICFVIRQQPLHFSRQQLFW